MERKTEDFKRSLLGNVSYIYPGIRNNAFIALFYEALILNFRINGYMHI